MSAERLTVILNRLLPGDPETGWPAAGSLGLADRVRTMAAERGETERLDDIQCLLPDDFDARADREQIAALEVLESENPDAFGVLILYAYGAYYTDNRVREVVEERTGYPARPPQPEGYELPPFDEGLLEKVKQRSPFWRRV